MTCYLNIFILTKTDNKDADSVGSLIESIPRGSASRMDKNIILRNTNKGEI
jgi:hypothetical protein